jgi:hypothetical protein
VVVAQLGPPRLEHLLVQRDGAIELTRILNGLS